MQFAHLHTLRMIPMCEGCFFLARKHKVRYLEWLEPESEKPMRTKSLAKRFGLV
jgi:hypothetical protein